MTQAPKSLNDLRDLLAGAPDGDIKARQKTADREATLTKPPGALGQMEEIAQWLAEWQGRAPPVVNHPEVIVFAGNHGVTEQGVSAFPADVTAQMVSNFERGGAAVNQLSKTAGASFQVIPIALDDPTEDFTKSPAMSEDAFIDAFNIGWHAIGNDTDLLCVGEMGIGNTTSAAALCHSLFGGSAEDWTGPGTGVAGDTLSHKASVVAAAVKLHTSETDDPLEFLRRLGGRELAAMAGAIASARYRQLPVLLDGYVAGAAAAALEKFRSGSLDHTLAAHVSAEPGHKRLLDNIDKSPLLDLGMRLGEASGAALAINIVRAAADCHAGMATFADAGVSGKSET